MTQLSRILPVLGIALLVLALSSGIAMAQDVYKVNYFSNNAAPAPDATVRIDNPGLTYGNLCAMVYVFDADQQLSECCGWVETHNGLRTHACVPPTLQIYRLSAHSSTFSVADRASAVAGRGTS